MIRVWFALAFLVCACGSTTRDRARAPTPWIRTSVENGNYYYTVNGTKHAHGAWGGGLREAVRGVPRAERAAESYQWRVVGGGIAVAGGLLCSGTAFGLGLRTAGEDDSSAFNASMYVAIGCLTAAFVGTVVMVTGLPKRYDAINYYNDQVFEDLGAFPREAKKNNTPSLLLGHIEPTREFDLTDAAKLAPKMQ